jgi:hypothetical protein
VRDGGGGTIGDVSGRAELSLSLAFFIEPRTSGTEGRLPPARLSSVIRTTAEIGRRCYGGKIRQVRLASFGLSISGGGELPRRVLVFGMAVAAVGIGGGIVTAGTFLHRQYRERLKPRRFTVATRRCFLRRRGAAWSTARGLLSCARKD